MADIVLGSYKLLYIKIAGEFKPIGCLTDNSFSETTGTIETTTRENTDGWSSAAPTNQGYTIPFAGVNTLSDDGGTIADYDALQNLKRTRTIVEWQIRSGQGGAVDSGTGIITDLSNSAPEGGEVTFSGTILGSGLPITTPAAAGDPPTNFRNSDPATTNCFVEWDKSITGAMQSYRVYQSSVLFREFIGDVNQGTLTGLVPATTYSNMTCRGWDGVEETPDSNIISFTTASQASIIVIDNLDSTSATDALSANQGRILNETKVSSVVAGTNVTVDATDPVNPIVASIQRAVVDNLISTSAVQSLSANQGKILNDTKLNDVFAGSNVTVDKTDPLSPIISSVPGTTAGLTRRVYFTGDALILSETFYETNGANKGTVASIQQQVTNGDNQTTFFAVDFIGAAAVYDETLIGGNYTGHLEMEVDNNAGNQRYDIEIYLADAQGIPFNSGITNAPIGDLGVELLALGTTGIFDVEDDNPTSVVYVFSLNENVDIPAGTRVRYHISATKVGTDGGNVVMSLYSGSDWTAYLDAPAPVTTEGVINSDDTITGATQYDVNRNVDTYKAGLDDPNEFTQRNQFPVIRIIANEFEYGDLSYDGINFEYEDAGGNTMAFSYEKVWFGGLVNNAFGHISGEGNGFGIRSNTDTITLITSEGFANVKTSDLTQDDGILPTKPWVRQDFAPSKVTGEPTGSTKASNQVVISDADYGDGSTAVTGTLYFIKP